MFTHGVGVLGPLEIRVGGRSVPIAGTKVRIVLAMLCLENGRGVSVDSLRDALWGEDPPPTAANAIQVYVASVRKLMQELRLDGSLETVGHGYRLTLAWGSLDRDQFLASRGQAMEALAMNRREAAALHLREALAVWRGPALEELAGVPAIDVAAAELDRLELDTFETFAENELILRHERQLIVPLERRAREHPLRESLWAMLALALYRSGQQVPALAALRQLRATLDNELGIAPSDRVRDLEVRMLRQDPGLIPVAAPEGGPEHRERTEPDRTITEQNSDLPRLTARLTLSDGRSVTIERRSTLIGRAEACDLPMASLGVSARHAVLTATANGHVIEDLHSTNGTFVNGEAITRRVLVTGDLIELGRTPLRYERIES